MFGSRKRAKQTEADRLAAMRRIDDELSELRNRCSALEAVVNGHTIALGQQRQEGQA